MTNPLVAYGEGFHLYEECFEDDNMYLMIKNPQKYEIRHEEAYGDSVTVSMSVALWEEIVKTYLARKELNK